MIDHRSKVIIIHFIVLVSLCTIYEFVCCSAEASCIENERAALLAFKKGLIDHGGVFSSWQIEKDCCKWNGVRCSNTTGHVTDLLLRGDWSRDYYLEGNNISPALLELHHLKVFDISGNELGGTKIPEFIGLMKNLEHLNLRESEFSGFVPPQLGNLTNLRTLDLSKNDIFSDNLNWLSRLSSLSRLDLSYSNITDPNWPRHVMKLPSLQELYLQYSYIPNVATPFVIINSSSISLSVIDLTDTNLTSSIFDWLFNVSTSLTKICLSDNRLQGKIPDGFAKLNSLEYLDLSSNMLEGEIPKSLTNSSRLQTLFLSNNRLSGLVPEFKDFFGLRQLSLRGNRFTGSVPVNLGQLSYLEILDVSFNSLNGTILVDNFVKLVKLKVLDLSFNSLALNISPDWIPPFQLDVINLAGCEMGPRFPMWIKTQRSFSGIDLSCAGISNEAPKWLWSLSPSMLFLNLSHNQISGAVPDFSSELIVSIDVSSNEFSVKD